MSEIVKITKVAGTAVPIRGNESIPTGSFRRAI